MQHDHVKNFDLLSPPPGLGGGMGVGLQAKYLLPCYEGGTICNENPFITPPTNALGFYAICQTKGQSIAIIMVHETLFYLSKFNKLQTF